MQLLKLVRLVGKPTIVVLINGGVLAAEEIILNTDALVEAFHPGFYGAQAMSDVLFGDVNPGGKLPVTMYHSNYVDSVDMKSMSMTAYPGRSYRYFKEEPVFPFGWGLSYTTFALSNASEVSGGDAGTPSLTVTRGQNATISVIVLNDGEREGDEVVFAFFRPLATNVTGSATLLNQQLFDYHRVTLRPAEAAYLNFTVQQTTLALVDEAGNLGSFPGTYEVIITNGVHERLTFTVDMLGEQDVLQTSLLGGSLESSNSTSTPTPTPATTVVTRTSTSDEQKSVGITLLGMTAIAMMAVVMHLI